jgi:hypothetical protein
MISKTKATPLVLRFYARPAFEIVSFAHGYTEHSSGINASPNAGSGEHIIER